LQIFAPLGRCEQPSLTPSAFGRKKLSVMCRFWRWGRPCRRPSRGICRLLLQLTDAFFHLFAGFERNYPFFRDIDTLAGSRITCLPRRPLLDFEDSEVAKFNAMVGHERFDDGVKRLLDNLFGLELGQTNFIGNRFHDFFFGHGSILPREMRPEQQLRPLSSAE
jgi:hypothetical protein